MDQAAIETAKLLGTGSAQIILAVVAVVASGIAVWLGRTLYAEIKSCHAESITMLTRTIESNDKLSDAIESSARVSEAMLAQLRKP